jgi:thermostable 8-oxoguanine DNA glycosylase
MQIYWDTEDLSDALKAVGLQVNVEKSKYMVVSRHQNADQNPDIKITKRSFENVSQFEFFSGNDVTNFDSCAN